MLIYCTGASEHSDGNPVICREESGSDNGVSTTPGETHEKALKEAETDAMKRALSTFGKPVRLHPEPTNYTYKYYVPQFAEGDPRWDLRRIFPYGDFPEHGGRSVIELSDSD